MNGKRVLVTGASSGIGAEVARAFASRGATVVISARRSGRLEQLASSIEQAGAVRPVIVVADLSQRGEAKRLGDEAAEAIGGIDVLVNNAGAAVAGHVWQVGDSDAARSMLELNYWSPLALISAVVPKMVEADSGTIVNVTSMSQIQNWAALSNYSSAKAALAQVTETLRLELAGTNVAVLEVIPGPTQTAAQAETRLLPGIDDAMRGMPVGDPTQLAKRVVRAVENGKQRVVFPQPMWVSYVLPGVTRFLIRRAIRKAGPQIDVHDTQVRRSGSSGDPEAQQARHEWEAAFEAGQ